MNKSIFQSIAFGLVVAFASLPLYAQTTTPDGVKKDETVAKVETNEGVIMISQEGAEFATALPDERVKSKTRLMVSEDSSATVVYDDGCRHKYDKAGVYEISERCVVALLPAAGTKGWVLAATVFGGGAIALLIDHGGKGDPRPPVSR